MKRILQNFRKSGRDEALGTSDLTGRSFIGDHLDNNDDEDDTSLYVTGRSFIGNHLNDDDDDNTSLYTTNNNSYHPQPPQVDVDYSFTDDYKVVEKRESALCHEKNKTNSTSSYILPPPPVSQQRSPRTIHKARTTVAPRPAPLHATTVVEEAATTTVPKQQNQQQQQQFPPDRYAETRDLVKKFIAEIWNRGAIDLIPSVCSPSLRCNGNNGFDRIGHDGLAKIVKKIRESLQDYHCEIHSMVVEDNKCFCRLRFSGKHVGDLLGIEPTYRSVAWMGATEFTCQNGKIIKVWELGDLRSLEEQLKQGVILE